MNRDLYLHIRDVVPVGAAVDAFMYDCALCMAAADALGNREEADMWFQAIQIAQHQRDLETLARIEQQRECDCHGAGEGHAA